MNLCIHILPKGYSILHSFFTHSFPNRVCGETFGCLPIGQLRNGVSVLFLNEVEFTYCELHRPWVYSSVY